MTNDECGHAPWILDRARLWRKFFPRDLSAAELCDCGEFRRAERHHGEARILEERNVIQLGRRLDRVERDRLLEGLHRHEIDAVPARFIGRRIRIRCARDFRDADDFLPDDRVVKKNEVALFHRPEIVPRLEIPDAGPRRAAVARELLPRVGGGFLFDHPVLWHGGKTEHAAMKLKKKTRDPAFHLQTQTGGPTVPLPPHRASSNSFGAGFQITKFKRQRPRFLIVICGLQFVIFARYRRCVSSIWFIFCRNASESGSAKGVSSVATAFVLLDETAST